MARLFWKLQQGLDVCSQLRVLAGGKEQLAELLAGHSALEQVRIDALQAIDEGLKGGSADAVQDLLVPLLGLHALLGVALAVAEAEQLLKAVLQVELAAPAKALGKRHGHGVAIVDMGKGVGVHGVFHMAADDTGEAVQSQHGTLAGAAADYVITGCGTGEGAMLALNSFPGVICGHVEDPVDAYTFAHVNDGNAVALPFAKGFGWGGELNLEYIFEKLFGFGHGQGYPKERVVPEQRNKKILDGVRAIAFRDLSDILKDLDRDLVKGAFAGEHFAENFFPACKDEKLAATVKELMA